MSVELSVEQVRGLLERMDGAEADFQAGRGSHEGRVTVREGVLARLSEQALPLARTVLEQVGEIERLRGQLNRAADVEGLLMAERDGLREAVADALWEHVAYDAPRRAKAHLLKVMSIDELHTHMEARAALASPAGAEAGGR